jgi:hypothetical protein
MIKMMRMDISSLEEVQGRYSTRLQLTRLELQWEVAVENLAMMEKEEAIHPLIWLAEELLVERISQLLSNTLMEWEKVKEVKLLWWPKGKKEGAIQQLKWKVLWKELLRRDLLVYPVLLIQRPARAAQYRR